MATRRARRRATRRRLIRLAIVAGVLVVLGLALQLAGPRLAQPALVALLERQGFAPVRLQVASVGLTGVTITDLAVGGATATRADVTVSLLGLIDNRADRLAITGLRLAGTLDGNGLALTGFAATSGAGAMPVDRIVLDDAVIALTTPNGPATMTLDAALTTRADGASVQIARAAIAAPELALRASGIEAQLEQTGERWRLDARGQVADTRAPARVVPLNATLTAERRGDTIALDATARDAKGQLALAAKGQHAIAAGRGSVQLTATPKPFVTGGLQPRDVSPLLGEGLPPIEGAAAVAGTLAWSRAGLTPDLVVTLKDVAVDLGAARLVGGRGAVRLDGLLPPSTPPDQRLTGSLAFGTASLPLAIDLALRRDGTIAVSSLSLEFADGELALTDIVVPPTRPGTAPADLALPLQVHGADLSALLTLIAIDGLSGDGRLDGSLPLRLTRDAKGARQIVLDHGQLAARGPGTVRYVGTALPKPAGSGGEAVGLLTDALKDFRYRSLTIELDRRPDGPDGAILHLTGANPAVLNGRAFVLNIRLDADFDRLATVFLAGFDAAGRLAHDLSRK